MQGIGLVEAFHGIVLEELHRRLVNHIGCEYDSMVNMELGTKLGGFCV